MDVKRYYVLSDGCRLGEAIPPHEDYVVLASDFDALAAKFTEIAPCNPGEDAMTIAQRAVAVHRALAAELAENDAAFKALQEVYSQALLGWGETRDELAEAKRDCTELHTMATEATAAALGVNQRNAALIAKRDALRAALVKARELLIAHWSGSRDYLDKNPHTYFGQQLAVFDEALRQGEKP